MPVARADSAIQDTAFPKWTISYCLFYVHHKKFMSATHLRPQLVSKLSLDIERLLNTQEASANENGPTQDTGKLILSAAEAEVWMAERKRHSNWLTQKARSQPNDRQGRRNISEYQFLKTPLFAIECSRMFIFVIRSIQACSCFFG